MSKWNKIKKKSSSFINLTIFWSVFFSCLMILDFSLLVMADADVKQEAIEEFIASNAQGAGQALEQQVLKPWWRYFIEGPFAVILSLAFGLITAVFGLIGFVFLLVRVLNNPLKDSMKKQEEDIADLKKQVGNHLPTKIDEVQNRLETDMKDLKTEIKTDIRENKKELKAEITENRVGLKAEITENRVELKAEITENRVELKAEMTENKKELKADIKSLEAKNEKHFEELKELIKENHKK